MVKYQRMPQKSKGGQGDKNQEVQGEGHWYDLSASGIRRKSVKGRMGGVRFRFYKKPQILHRETQFSGILEGYG